MKEEEDKNKGHRINFIVINNDVGKIKYIPSKYTSFIALFLIFNKAQIFSVIYDFYFAEEK